MENKLIKLKPEFVKLGPKDRLYECPWPMIGITGGIASGKSTACRFLSDRGLAVVSADHLVKLIYGRPESVAFIKKHFPAAIGENQAIHFPTLRKIAFDHPGNRTLLENFLYPQLGWAFDLEFKRLKDRAKYECIVYDVPLLFEKQLQAKLDLSVCVYSTSERQLEQMVKRDNIDHELAKKMIEGQLPLSEKLKLADRVIRNEADLVALELACDEFIRYVALSS